MREHPVENLLDDDGLRDDHISWNRGPTLGCDESTAAHIPWQRQLDEHTQLVLNPLREGVRGAARWLDLQELAREVKQVPVR